MMAKDSGKVQIHGKTYLTVAYRVNQLREDHLDWGIETEIVENTESLVVMKAYIKNPEGQIIGTGFAEENRNSSQINRTSALENCETSAIGRALAACGYGGTEYASANEVQNAIHQQNTEKVKIKPDVKNAVHEQTLACLETGDEHGLKQIWAEFDADEKTVLWAMFNSQQRASMKELMK